VGGKELVDEQKKAPPQIASDGIALDPKDSYLYYHALTARTLYRVKTGFLTDEACNQKDLEAKIEMFARLRRLMECSNRQMAAFI